MEEIKFQDIANRSDVLNRARQNLKKDGVYLTEDQIEDIFDAQMRYIEKVFRKGDKSSLYFPEIGTAYFPITYCNRMKNMYKFKAKEGDKSSVEGFNRWKKRAIETENGYQDNQTRKNSKKWYQFKPVIMPFRTRASIRGMKMEDLEELQNNM